MNSMRKMFLTLFMLLTVNSALAQANTVDGVIGPEWNGVVAKTVTFDAAAPISNFATPGPSNNLVAYKVYIRADSNFVYGAFQTVPAGAGLDDWNGCVGGGLGNVVNLYVDTNPGTGSDLGFEINNNRAFKPGTAGYFDNIRNFGVIWAVNAPVAYPNAVAGVSEIAIPWTYLANDPQGIGFPRASSTNSFVQWRLVQAFGFSVSGGITFGDTRLGTVGAPTGVFPVVAVPALGWQGLLLLIAAIVFMFGFSVRGNYK
jgi:hypothetical protein